MEQEKRKCRYEGAFKAYYNSLPSANLSPKAEFIKRISDVCMVHPTTVRCWLYGSQKPDELRRKLISKELNIPVEKLF